MRREVLGRGSVGIRLAFLSRFGVVLFHGTGRNRVVMFLEMFGFRGWTSSWEVCCSSE